MVESLQLDLVSRETFFLTETSTTTSASKRARCCMSSRAAAAPSCIPRVSPKAGCPRKSRGPASRSVARCFGEVPWKLFLGRSGFLPHFGLATLFALAFWIDQQLLVPVGLAVSASILATLFIGALYAFIGGVATKAFRCCQSR